VHNTLDNVFNFLNKEILNLSLFQETKSSLLLGPIVKNKTFCKFLIVLVLIRVSMKTLLLLKVWNQKYRLEDGQPVVVALGGINAGGLEIWQTWDEVLVDKAAQMPMEVTSSHNLMTGKCSNIFLIKKYLNLFLKEH